MDELVIGEKKYISSKQAAKATGYAKDYIGQLCREGRVPARLVGRSWYVLESAIHDHRFGEPKDSSIMSERQEQKTPVSAWDSPRYTAADSEILPSINRLQTDSIPTEEGKEEPQRLQDTWQAWFDRFDNIVNAPVSEREIRPEELKNREEETIIEQADTVVPIHTIRSDSYYQSLPVFQEPILRQQNESKEAFLNEKLIRERSAGIRRVLYTVRLLGFLTALFMAIAATFGSGYLDEYIISSNTARMITGVVVYQK